MSYVIKEHFSEDKKIFKITYDNITFKWEELDIKIFNTISYSFPLSFAIHNDFIKKDKDKISHEKFLDTYKCFISIYGKQKIFLSEKLKREYISILINDENFFFNPFGTFWYILFCKYENINQVWNFICNFGHLEKTNFKNFPFPYIEKNFINNETSIIIPKQRSEVISKIKNLLITSQ